MRLTVRVTPRAKAPRVDAAPDGHLVVRVTEPAQDGRANTALVALLAAHLGVPKRSVKILHGRTSRTKLIEIV